MISFQLELQPCGSDEHLADLAWFRQQSLPVPHSYSSWPLHHHAVEWLWVRVLDQGGGLHCAFAVALLPSRAIPGMRIGRIEHVGGALHQDCLPSAGHILAAIADKIPRLLRLEIHLFDKNPARKIQFANEFVAAGATPLETPRSYSHTLSLDLRTTTEEVLFQQLSSRMRRNLRKTARQPHISIEPIDDAQLAARMRLLHHNSFDRHQGSAPELDVAGMIEDACSGIDSRLLGAFDNRRPAPDHLIAFAWATFHGDHATYEHAASEPLRNASAIAPGAALMWQLILWARKQGASWFDLGGTLPPDTPADHPLQGITTFKKGFSQHQIAVSDEFMFEPHPLLTGAIHSGRQMARRIKAFTHRGLSIR